MLEIRVDRDPHNDGVPLFAGYHVRLNPGWTSVIGCTGSGRTSLLEVIYNKLFSHFDAIALEDYLELEDPRYVKHVTCKWSLSECSQWIITEPLLFRPPWLYDEIVRSVCSKIQAAVDKIKASNPATEVIVLLDDFDTEIDTFRASAFKTAISKVITQLPKQIYVVSTANSYDLVSTRNNLWVNNFRYYTFRGINDFKRLIEASVIQCNNRIERIHERDKSLMKPI